MEEVFIGPLRANKVLPENDLRAIFGDWGTLVKTTDMIYQDLKRSVETRKPGGMAAVFAEFAPFLRAYGPFLINYEAGVKRKAELLEASDAGGDGSGGGGGGGGNIFKAFLDAALRDQRCRGLDLGSFLIMPVQRVPRYKLLLESLLKETPPSHPERAVVTKALQAVSDAAAHNNASMAATPTPSTASSPSRYLALPPFPSFFSCVVAPLSSPLTPPPLPPSLPPFLPLCFAFFS